MTAGNASSELPPSVGRLIQPNETAPPRTWMIDGLVCEGEVNAYAVPNAEKRTAIGNALLAGVLAGESHLFGHRIRTRPATALILASSERAVWSYREAHPGNGRVTTVRLRQRSSADHA